MATIQELYTQSTLSLAAYATLVNTIPLSDQTDALEDAGMTAAQAKDFADKWTVKDQKGGITGVSATVFADNADKPYLAIRGTQLTDPLDWLADLILGVVGLAPANPQFYGLATIVNGWLTDGSNGNNSTLSQDFTVTGHSLGGYLTVGLGNAWPLLESLSSKNINITSSYTYNGPNEGGIIGGLAGLAMWITNSYPDPSSENNVNITRGLEGLSLIGGVGVPTSQPTLIGISDSSTHSIINITNSLAVQNLLSNLDKNRTIGELNKLMDATGADNSVIQKDTLNAVRKLLDNNINPDQNGNSDFWTALLDLEKSDTYKALINKVTISTDPISASDARNDFSAFLSMANLTPFMLKTTDADALSVLKNANPTLASDWEDDLCLNPELLADGGGHYSDAWLADRVIMLQQLILRNTDKVQDMEAETTYRDIASDLTFSKDPSTDSSPDNKYVIFGGETNDFLTGQNKDDRMYGTNGTDLFSGNKGNDYIEGGFGNDFLNGNEGDDTLLGGDGNDFLKGGDDKDVLKGGKGYDIYYAGKKDIIEDIEEEGFDKGQVYLDDIELKGGTKQPFVSVWKDNSGNSYMPVGTTLFVLNTEQSLLKIKNFKNDDLGIHLDDMDGGMGGSETILSPIALDLNGDGITTTERHSGAYFDHDRNGFAEQTGWINPQDGLLVHDLNNNGKIDNGGELFGSETSLNNGQKAANGYIALAELDSNANKQIDAQDAAFANLKIWQDTNGDGQSSAEELFTLADKNIQSISVDYTTIDQTDVNGNITKQISTFTNADGSISSSADIWFQTNKIYTIATEFLPETAEVTALPDLGGHGVVYDLQKLPRSQPTFISGVLSNFVSNKLHARA